MCRMLSVLIITKFVHIYVISRTSPYVYFKCHTVMYLQYLNDLEKDKRYQNWPSSVQDILRPTFPGMLRHVAKNFFHLVSSE